MIAPYLDASAIIYLLEGSTAVRAKVAAHIASAEKDPNGRLIVSRLARLECRVKPLRRNDSGALATIDAFFTRGRVQVVDVSAAILERATELRARHGFKTPDAIHLATAVDANADAFLTGDAELAKCPGLAVEVIAP